LLENILLGDSFGIYGCSQEFLKVNGTATIYVDPRDNFVDIAYISFQAKFVSEYVNSLLELVLRNCAVAIVVEDLKNLSDLEFFFTRNKLRSNILENSGMQAALGVEVLKIFESIHVQWVRIGKFDFCKILYPLIIQGLFG